MYISYMYILYICWVMGIGLCNLVTTLVVEFHKVVEEEEKLEEEMRNQRLRAIKEKVRGTFRGIRTFAFMRQRLANLCSETPPVDRREVMVGHHNSNWRKKLVANQHKGDDKTKRE